MHLSRSLYPLSGSISSSEGSRSPDYFGEIRERYRFLGFGLFFPGRANNADRPIAFQVLLKPVQIIFKVFLEHSFLVFLLRFSDVVSLQE